MNSTHRLRSDAADNRRRILETAATVFAERGVGVDVREIARVAQVGMGTLYRHFPTKEQLVEAVLHDVRERWLAQSTELLADDSGHGLERFMRDTLLAFATHRGLLESFTRDFGPLIAEGVTSPEVHALVSGLIRRAVTRGLLRPDVTSDDIGHLLIGVGRTIELTEQASPGTWRRSLAIILDGLRPQAVGQLTRVPEHGGARGDTDVR
jgi:AcrR family transcriptional regulator